MCYSIILLYVTLSPTPTLHYHHIKTLLIMINQNLTTLPYDSHSCLLSLVSILYRQSLQVHPHLMCQMRGGLVGFPSSLHAHQANDRVTAVVAKDFVHHPASTTSKATTYNPYIPGWEGMPPSVPSERSHHSIAPLCALFPYNQVPSRNPSEDLTAKNRRGSHP